MLNFKHVAKIYLVRIQKTLVNNSALFPRADNCFTRRSRKIYSIIIELKQ